MLWRVLAADQNESITNMGGSSCVDTTASVGRFDAQQQIYRQCWSSSSSGRQSQNFSISNSCSSRGWQQQLYHSGATHVQALIRFLASSLCTCLHMSRWLTGNPADSLSPRKVLMQAADKLLSCVCSGMLLHVSCGNPQLPSSVM